MICIKTIEMPVHDRCKDIFHGLLTKWQHTDHIEVTGKSWTHDSPPTTRGTHRTQQACVYQLLDPGGFTTMKNTLALISFFSFKIINMRFCWCSECVCFDQSQMNITVKILKFGTPQTIAIIVLKLVKFDVTLH